ALDDDGPQGAAGAVLPAQRAAPAVVVRQVVVGLVPGVGPRGEVGERELARLAGPARLPPGLVDRGRALGEHVRRAAAHDPSVAEQCDPAEAGLGRAAEDELGPAGPNRLGPDRAGETV